MTDDDKTRILTSEDAARLAALAGESDDRTRVLSAKEAARLLARAETSSGSGGGRNPPRLVGGKIVFFCSNGHRIAVDSSLAGKRGNCSKQGCGVPVVIPVPAGLDVRSDEPAAQEPTAQEPAVVEPSDAPPAFDFGAAAARDQAPPAEGTSAVPPPAPPGEDGAQAPAWDFVAGGPAPEAADRSAVDAGPGPETGGWTIDIDEIDHPAARLVARLWHERAHGGVVEVHLAGGGVIMPEFYDPRWSCGEHAVFAALAPDNTVTLTAVAWDQVQRVVVRQVQGKPDGMFGE